MNLQWYIDIHQQHRVELVTKALRAKLCGETRLGELFQHQAEREGERIQRLLAELVRTQEVA